MSREIGQYKIFNEIGKGSFGTVFKGVDKLSGEEVALKFIEKRQKRPRDIKNLREENDLLKKINHPNVICLKDVIETPKEIIIVTDYAGQDLSGVIAQVRRFSLDKVRDYSTQILNAMLYLNQNRIIHRDLKPQNILIKGNHIKICDFGFAKKLSASTNFMQSMKGTPLYLAPEIVKEVKYTEKVDIWSFGCIIYELFTGKTPYYANTYNKLVPLILHQPINYPKEMPAELKDLISLMLQKNPFLRPDWKQLKNHPFFKQNQALKQKIDNNCLKEVVSIEIPEKPFLPEKPYMIPEPNKENNNVPQQEQLIESKVIQKIQNQAELKNYQSEFKKIYAELLANIIDGKQLRKDIIFLHKIKTVFHERSQKNPLITNQLIEACCNIINYLIKLRKGNSNNENAADTDNNDDDDITKNTALIFGLLCLAKVQTNYDMLEKELQTIGRLVKGTFNGVAINSQIDEEITEFVTEILLENTQNLPIQCIKTGLITIGIMVNQAMLTLNNSFDYFERVAEDNLLTKIAKIYRKQQKYGTVLQLLKAFVHPGKKIANMTGNPHHLVHPKMQRIFQTLKQEVAEALLKTDFFSEVSPLDVYSEKSPIMADYCCVLLECLRNSSESRKQFLKYNYWNRLLSCKKLKSFVFAYNSIFIEYEDKIILSNQQMVKSTQESHQNKLNNISILQMSYLKLKRKPDCISGLKFKKSLVEKVYELIFIDQTLKSNFCQQVYGFLDTPTKKFDEPLIELFFNMVTGIKPAPMQNCEQHKQLVQAVGVMFKKICQTSNSFKPTSKSLFWLMSLLTESDLVKNAKCQKPVQAFFYESITDFIRREDFEYLENQFPDNQIPKFIAKLVQTFNLLVEVQEIQTKTCNLSSNAVNITKLIQTSSFYRFMFIDDLPEDCFYEHLKCSLKIIAKTAQTPQFINFLGVKVIPMSKNYINTKMQTLLTQIFAFLSAIAREHSQFNNQILDTGIIKKFREWLTSPTCSEYVKEKVMYLVGNLAKKSDFFFGEFQAYSTIDAIAVCLKDFYTNPKILKNAIYSIGNISFYSQKFFKEIEPMIPYFAKAFDTNDPNVKNNLISTTSNLMRYSNIFLSQLIKTGLIGNILKMACELPQMDQNLGGLIMSLVKKILPYDQFYQAFGCKELKTIYQRRQMFGGDSNETIKKIKAFLVSHGQLI